MIFSMSRNHSTNTNIAYIDLCSSTPHESELIEVNTLVLTEVGSGQEQLIILNGQAMMGSSVTIVDARTLRVHLAIGDDFFRSGTGQKSIELMGFAKVKDIALGADAPSLSTQFMLELEVFDVPLAFVSSSPTTSTPPTVTAIPTVIPPFGTKVCQCDQKSNVCVTDDLQISYDSKDDIHICIV